MLSTSRRYLASVMHAIQPTHDGRTAWQSELLVRREELLRKLEGLAASYGITDPLIVRSTFTDVFLRLRMARNTEGRRLPNRYVEAIARRLFMRWLSVERVRHAREQTYSRDFLPYPLYVGGIRPDDVDFRALPRILRARADGSLAGRLALELAEHVATETAYPTQNDLAAALGVTQSSVSRATPRALDLLRQAFSQIEPDRFA